LRQLLTEGLILSVFAAAGGLLVAHWCRNLLVLLLPPRGATMHLPGEIDWRVLALSVGVCVVSTLLFALVPAIQASKIDLAGALKAEAGGAVGGRGKSRARSVLVLVQLSLSFVLLVGAGLLIQSTLKIRAADPGFTTRGVLATGVDLVAAGYDAQRARGFQDELRSRLLGLGGVESVTFARIPPFSYAGYSSAPIAIDGDRTAADDLPTVYYDEVGPAYLATMGIPLLAGREFTREDDESAPLVAVVNQAMADQYWRGQDPIGRRLQVKGRWMQVVGIAKMSKYASLTEAPKPFFYVPMRQSSAGRVLLIRTSLGSEAMTKALVREIHALDANLAPGEVITMQDVVDRKTAVQRAAGRMLGLFGGLALLLAAVGLHGVMSYAVSQRRRELGLRMALGADAGATLRLVMGRSLLLIAGGTVSGLMASVAVTRVIAGLLYAVGPLDPLVFVSVSSLLAGAGIVATLIPARRATRVDPIIALRIE